MNDSVWLALSDTGQPTAMTWRDVEYQVTDTPTRLEEDWFFVTHEPPCPFGWRFQGRPLGGENQIFDVRFDQRLERWFVARTYA
ncbi:hypothetical protein [Pseudolysinimonas sp.]|uniref:hypothetical protein n=1 Tax=Pseudolysinimonas sp. TaxID=2680009 RepID=UPI0037842C6F